MVDVKAEQIADVLRKLSGQFIVEAAKAGIDVNYLTMEWRYNDGSHECEGGI